MEICELWRYPVASFAGERCGELCLMPMGPEGDRAFVAIRSGDLKVASPETDGAWRRAPEIEARGDPPSLRLPGGDWLSLPGVQAELALGRFFGFPVGLKKALAFNRPHPDGVPVRAPRLPLHLVTTWQLNLLRSAMPDSHVAVERFRPNLVIEANREETERMAMGSILRAGTCRIEIVEQTVRCGFIALAQNNLPKDGKVLKHLRRHSNLRFGFGCRVHESGRLFVGDGLWFEARKTAKMLMAKSSHF
ncbi:MAG: MOSC domain-containing protein [Pseudomonadota bacterium]|nr:MOSC domain-containing protein [Pseudomonadota bacterium]